MEDLLKIKNPDREKAIKTAIKMQWKSIYPPNEKKENKVNILTDIPQKTEYEASGNITRDNFK